MPAFLVQTLRSRWFAFCIHAGLWLLLYLAATNLGGRTPVFRDTNSSSAPPQTVAPVTKLEPLFSGVDWHNLIRNPTNASNPFFTRFFIPPPSPAPPPPPTTRKIEVTYQGYYQTGAGPKYAMLKVAEALMVAKVGGLVATNVYVADATIQTVTLTNPAAQTNILPLNIKKEIEVPIR